ncbi:MAG: glycosyltransferase family 4 protein [Gemmataceae bacterium]
MSARHFTDLAEGLVRRGWDVTVCPSNRGYPDETKKYPLREFRNGVAIQRIWRPRFRQAGNIGRILNAAWMILIWGGQALTTWRNRPQVVLIGTDPILSVLAAIPWKVVRPRVVIAHWGFDIYPEAAVAEGMLSPRSTLVRMIRWGLRWAYRSCDVIVDIGSCMRDVLASYGSAAQVNTLTPWALVEPARPTDADSAIRRELFGDASLGVLYSGTFGRAHSYEEILALARKLRGEPIAFCFAGRGNRVEQLKQAITAEDSNIRFAGFAAEADLEKRLGAADIHLTSLQPAWTGTVVPSKFFGSLAIGRPVIFAGAGHAAVAHWIKEYDIGWLLNASTLDDTADALRQLARSPDNLRQLQARCYQTYQDHFARERVLDGWDRVLRAHLGSVAGSGGKRP